MTAARRRHRGRRGRSDSVTLGPCSSSIPDGTTATISIDALTFDDDGIGVDPVPGRATAGAPLGVGGRPCRRALERRGHPRVVGRPRAQPRARPPPGPARRRSPTRPATNRALPGHEPGALIGIQTPTRPTGSCSRGRCPGDLPPGHRLRRPPPGPGRRVLGDQGRRWGQDAERRQVGAATEEGARWPKVQPFLVVVLVVFLAAAVTLILLQSAGTIHLPFLGGVGSGDRRPEPGSELGERGDPRRRSWYSGVLRHRAAGPDTPIEPATFIRPCMKATLGSRSPRCMATASSHAMVSVTSGSPTAPTRSPPGVRPRAPSSTRRRRPVPR